MLVNAGGGFREIMTAKIPHFGNFVFCDRPYKPVLTVKMWVVWHLRLLYQTQIF